jgi:hypothetical protein
MTLEVSIDDLKKSSSSGCTTAVHHSSKAGQLGKLQRQAGLERRAKSGGSSPCYKCRQSKPPWMPSERRSSKSIGARSHEMRVL